MLTETVHLHVGLPVRTIALVEASYARIQYRLDELSLAFCERLTPAHPHLALVFPAEDVEKRQIATSFLGFVVTNLRSADRLGELLERMGRRGLLNGLSAGGVDDIGRSLLAALADLEGDQWQSDTARAWSLVCAWTSALLRRGVAHGSQGDSSR